MPESVRSTPYVSPESPEHRPCPYKKGSKVYFCEKVRGKTSQWAAVVKDVRSRPFASGYAITVDIVDPAYTGRRQRKVNFPSEPSHHYIFQRS